MIKLPRFLLRCSLVALMPVAANAAGTYYTGNYQSPQQQRYANQSYSSQRGGGTFTQNGVTYNRVQQPNAAGYYNNNQQAMRANNVARQNNAAPQQIQNKQNNRSGMGFSVGGGLSREYAMWQFEMKDAGSKLRYDDVAWNVLDLNAAYVFDAGQLKLKLDGAFKYGFQGGDAHMVDDDITGGGYFITQWLDGNKDNEYMFDQVGHALSAGTSSGGNMWGFNVGLGMVDLFTLGNVKFSPSVGYRYLKYKLETKKNYGLAVDSANCYPVPGTDEMQCDPAIIAIITKTDGKVTEQILWERNDDGYFILSPGAALIDEQGTYYYQQPGTSHSYEVAWGGPYIALDMEYDINQYNQVSGRVELGFPGYTSTADQPYRRDWAHPKSIEDKASMFSAMHLGLGAQWLTALTDSVSLSLGVTYDYYTVSGADAKTYLNESYYQDIVNEQYDKYLESNPGASYVDMLESGTPQGEIALSVEQLAADCPGWVCSSNGEIDSFYKSLGVRLGVIAKF